MLNIFGIAVLSQKKAYFARKISVGMERIKLSGSEKAVLRMVAGGQGVCPSEYPSHTFNAAVHALDRKGLVRGAYVEGGGVEDARLTQYGRLYTAENPNLRNPVNWSMWATVIAAAGVVASVIALLAACGKI